jgi:hypothetical protein
MSKVKLPDKLSELIRVAVQDMEACRIDPRYKLDMSVWHIPRDGICRVCMAGAVLAKTCGYPKYYGSFMLASEILAAGLVEGIQAADAFANKLLALNAVRAMDLRYAFILVGYGADKAVDLEPFDWEHYHHMDPDGATLLRLADHLERQGY